MIAFILVLGKIQNFKKCIYFYLFIYLAASGVSCSVSDSATLWM